MSIKVTVDSAFKRPKPKVFRSVRFRVSAQLTTKSTFLIPISLPSFLPNPLSIETANQEKNRSPVTSFRAASSENSSQDSAVSHSRSSSIPSIPVVFLLFLDWIRKEERKVKEDGVAHSCEKEGGEKNQGLHPPLPFCITWFSVERRHT